MKGPVDTVSIPVPLHEGHLSGLDSASLPFPGNIPSSCHAKSMLYCGPTALRLAFFMGYG